MTTPAILRTPRITSSAERVLTLPLGDDPLTTEIILDEALALNTYFISIQII